MTLTEEKNKEQTLKATDRCDACNAQAFVLVSFMNGELLFCGHHFRKYENSLIEQAYDILDEREFI